jgi:nucleoside 2-deoxyribosyltransferase
VGTGQIDGGLTSPLKHRSRESYNLGMPTCFVIQPFDGGPFDKRFEDIVAPAIRAADLEPYRVDQDPGVTIPIEQIEEGIRSAAACVADITSPNPNVWYELGYAVAAGKPVLLMALDEPSKRFPFDIQHRHVIRYKTDSARDFKALATELTSRLRAVLAKEEKLERVVMTPSVASVEGLSQHELVALVTIAENIEAPGSRVSAHTIRNDMERTGFTRVATTLALTVLTRKGLANYHDESDINGNEYIMYSLTSDGLDWLLQNRHTLLLRKLAKMKPSVIEDDDEEPPF